ncbi:MAG: 4-hydroxy-tetrahydrodipicolinate synthase [Promethearchaeota archaeon]
MSRLDQLSGTFTALITPFDENHEIDEEQLRSLVDFQVKNGVTGLVPMGTTGESATMSHYEHKRVVELVVERAKSLPQKPFVLAGTGSNSTREALELTRHAKETGADAALVITPYYNRPTQEGLVAHYSKIAEEVDLPIVMYNVPSRTGRNLEPDTVVRLAKLKNVVGVKEASGNLDQITRIIRETPDDFVVMSGDDGMTFAVMALGGQGVISVASNVVPRMVADLTDALAANDLPRARELHLRLYPLFKVLFVETNPGPVKYAAERLGIFKSRRMRLPMVPPTKGSCEKIEKVLADLGLLS